MFRRRTTLIVGAGCSAEYGLPIGDGLKDHIAGQLALIGRHDRRDGYLTVASQGADNVLLAALTQAGQSRGNNRWDLVANAMAPGIRHASSIDRYLHLHRDDEARVTIGKIAIARSILAAEQNSLLSRDSIDLPYIRNKNEGQSHWLQELMFRLQEDVTLENMKDIFSNLTIITFNYDRVIEHYLYHAVRELGGLTADAAAEIMTELRIIHPYGKIGRLPWQKEDGPPLPYGHWEDLHFNTIIEAGQRLRTFTETVEDEDLLASIRNGVRDAEQIAFVGFSFLQQNLDLIRPENQSCVGKVWATTYGMSEFDVSAAKTSISHMLNGADAAEYRSYSTHPIAATAGRFIADAGNLLRS